MFYPELIDVPEEFESERLLIRVPRPGDGPALNAAVRESFDDLSPWMPWADHIPEVDESESNVCAAYEKYKSKTDFRLFLFRKDTGELVGGSGLHNVDWSVPKFDIGYWVRSSCAGQGYITEAVNAITEFAFQKLGAHRVGICMDTRNTRSRMVAERAGFEFEGTVRHDARSPDGTLRDIFVYSKIR
ncbi:MAG: GNAT family N-acetyltransferase [Armatimonadota bacterium]